MPTPTWRAYAIVNRGNGLKNKWSCSACSKKCEAVLPLNEAPSDKCNGGYENEKAASKASNQKELVSLGIDRFSSYINRCFNFFIGSANKTTDFIV